MLKVKIDSRAWLAKESLSPQQLHSLRRALTVRPFNGYIADAEDVEPIPLYVETDRLFGVPRAFYMENRKRKNEELLMVSSGEPMRELETKMRFTGPFAGQVEAIERMVGYTEENEWGGFVLEAGCGWGKSNAALEFARRVGRRTLIIVHKEFFVEQWRKRILEFMPDARVGVVQADRCEYADCDFVIGMMQSLANDAMDKYPYDMFSSFGLVISDEVHRIGAKTWANVISLFNARYRVGLTATLRRKDRCEDVIFHHIGPVLYTAKGEAMVPVVRTVQTDFRLAPVLQRGKWIDVEKLMPVQVVTQIVSDQSRNRQIAEVVAEQVLKGRKVMVVSERLEHLKVLSGNIASVLLAYDSDLPFEPVIDYYTGEWFSGDIDRKTGQRKKRTRTAEERDKAESANVIMATRQMMEEGLDISAVDVLVLATPISDVEQTIGRVRRFCTPSKSKCERLCPWRAGECQSKPEPIVIDVVDRHVRRIVRKFEERRVFYEKIGSEVDGQQRLLRKLV